MKINKIQKMHKKPKPVEVIYATRARAFRSWLKEVAMSDQASYLSSLPGYADIDEAREHWSLVDGITTRPIIVMEQKVDDHIERNVIVEKGDIARTLKNQSEDDVAFEAICAAIDVTVFKLRCFQNKDTLWREPDLDFVDEIKEVCDLTIATALIHTGYAMKWNGLNQAQIELRIKATSELLGNNFSAQEVEVMGKAIQLIQINNSVEMKLRRLASA